MGQKLPLHLREAEERRNRWNRRFFIHGIYIPTVRRRVQPMERNVNKYDAMQSSGDSVGFDESTRYGKWRELLAEELE